MRWLDHEAFDVITSDVAYWIGFLFADGRVLRGRSGGPESAGQTI
jgi:hypothetical protein